MNALPLVFVVLFFALTPAHGLLSDATGLINRLDIQTGGHSFEVKVVSNFDIPDFEFDKDEKRLTLHITSGLENNLGEVLIPQGLLGGNFTFYLNDQEYFPLVNTNDKISFITLNFVGSGDHLLDIIGTIYLSGLADEDKIIEAAPLPPQNTYATADYSIWIVLAVLLIIVAASVVMVIRKRNQAKIADK